MKIRGIKTFCKKSKIELAVLFGSAASSGPDKAADIDIAVKYKSGVHPSKLELIYGLDGFFEGKNIDLVVLTSDTAPLLLSEIFSRGVCLYENNPGLFDNEKLRAWKLYLDTEKLRGTGKMYLRDFVRKVSHVT